MDFFNPNLRKKALEVVNNVSTESLINMLSKADPRDMPLSSYEMFKETLRKEMEPKEEDKNSRSIPVVTEHKPKPVTDKYGYAERSSYTSGYGPKGPAPGGMGSGEPRAYLEDLRPGDHEEFKIKQPTLSKPPKRREYLDDDIQSNAEDVSDNSETGFADMLG